MKGNVYTLCYSAVLGIVCALLLTAASNFTAPYKAANSQAEKIRNILTVLGIPLQPDTSAKELVEIFNANVYQQRLGEMTIYAYLRPGTQNKAAEAYAVEVSGQGLWGPIKGFLALESDMRTIRGITFHEQEETPGLGGEIASGSFRKQFIGKSIVDGSGMPGLVIHGTGNTERNKVDAITGATMTCDKVQAMLNRVIETIVKGQAEND